MTQNFTHTHIAPPTKTSAMKNEVNVFELYPGAIK